MQRGISVAIVDYGMGNLFSVAQACAVSGFEPVVTEDARVVAKADAIILPGVGAFADAIGELRRLGLASVLKDAFQANTPILGICLGLQLVMSVSHEFGEHQGLDLVKGDVHRLPADLVDARSKRRLKVPQVGWSGVHAPRRGAFDVPHMDGVAPGTYMYFVHSYYVKPADPAHAATVSRYGDFEFTSSVSVGSLFACQYHPERSGPHGLRMYENFGRLVRAASKEKS